MTDLATPPDRGAEGLPVGSSQRLGGVRVRRRRLRDALVDVEDAVASAAATAPGWRKTVATALEDLRAALEDHVRRNEEAGGLFDEILTHAPRLRARVDRLRAEHVALIAETEALLERCGHADLEDGEIAVVRERVLDLLTQASRHRQRGADLIYEAYEVDIAAGD